MDDADFDRFGYLISYHIIINGSCQGHSADQHSDVRPDLLTLLFTGLLRRGNINDL